MLDDSGFIESLTFQDLKDEYQEQKRKLLDSIDEKYKKDHDKMVELKQAGIEEDKRHRMILNACIFPFAQEDSLEKYGFYFLRASPLSELEVANFDFFLFHPDPEVQSIFGEAKGNVADPGRVADELRERISIVNTYQKYIKQNYLQNSDTESEFVIGVGWQDSNDMMKTIMRRGGKIKVWSVGITPGASKPTLSLVTPMREDGPDGKTMLHRNKDLSRTLSRIETSYDYKSIFPESHIFAKLVLLTLIREDPDGTFSFKDLYEIVRGELNYLPDEEVSKTTQHILERGKEIRFVEEIVLELEAGKSLRYKIISRWKKADMRAADLKKKWIEFAIDKDKEQEFNIELPKLQDVFRGKRSQRKGILELIDEASNIEKKQSNNDIDR